jgi:hypothetical protein
MFGKFMFDLGPSDGSFAHEAMEELAKSPAAADPVLLESAAIALLKNAGDLRPDLIAQLDKMRVQLLHGIKFKQRFSLVIAQREAIIDAHIRGDVQRRSAAEMGGPPEVLQPAQLFIAELAEGEAAIQPRADAA